MADLNKIVEDLSSLTVLEAAELSKLLEEQLGMRDLLQFYLDQPFISPYLPSSTLVYCHY